MTIALALLDDVPIMTIALTTPPLRLARRGGRRTGAGYHFGSWNPGVG